MTGRDFLLVAQELETGATEAHWRAASGRAYYSLMLEARDALARWGFHVPPGNQVHSFVRLRFVYAAGADLKQVGYALEDLGSLRNKADYRLSIAGPFTSARVASDAIVLARDNLLRLVTVEADLSRRTVAIADIRKAFSRP